MDLLSDFLRDQLSRRGFLQVTTGALIAGSNVAASDLYVPLPTHRFRVRCDSDLLLLEFSFVNLTPPPPRSPGVFSFLRTGITHGGSHLTALRPLFDSPAKLP